MSNQPHNPAEERNLQLSKHAQEAMRTFVARKRGVDASDICFPDLVHDENLVDLLTGLRHWAGNCAMDYRKADRLARRRHERELAEEALTPNPGNDRKDV